MVQAGSSPDRRLAWWRLLPQAELAMDAVVLALLTTTGVKPLSRLEYPVDERVWQLLRRMDLRIASLARVAENGARVTHWAMAWEASLLARYCAQYEGALLTVGVPEVVRSEARYFGYPACCADAFAVHGYAPNDLEPADQEVLFHHACPGCLESPKLVPLYRQALQDAAALLGLSYQLSVGSSSFLGRRAPDRD